MSDTDRPANESPEPAEDRWRHLPEHVNVQDVILSQPASDAPDVNGGRNPDHDWLLRGV